MEPDPSLSAIGGTATASTYDLLTGGGYAMNQDPYTAAGDGTITNTESNLPSGSGGAAPGAVAPPIGGGSSYTPPSWLTGITGTASSLLTAAGNANTTLQPILGGRPAPSPGAAGQGTPPPGAKTISFGGQTFSVNTVLIVGGAIVLGVLLLRKK